MKILYLSILLWFISIGAAAQDCPTENVVLTSQEQVDSFAIKYPDCTAVDVRITVGPSQDIINLDGLANLSVVGILFVGGNEALRSIAGLTNLESAEVITFSQNPLMQNLEGLENLHTVSTAFSVITNRSLKDISAVSNIDSLGLVYIRFNDSLEQIVGFDNIKTLDHFYIDFNTSLELFDAFHNVREIEDDLTIETSSNLTDFSGFGQLAHLGNLNIVANPRLRHVPTFSSLLSVERLQIQNNDSLQTIEGFDVLDVISKQFSISENRQLQEIDAFASLDTIREFTMNGLHSLNNLGTFESLKYIGGGLRILNNSTLEDISGLANVDPASVDSLRIVSNPMLSECNNEFLCNYIDTSLLTTIGNNAINCNSIDEVRMSCLTATDEVDHLLTAISIYPNPASESISLSLGNVPLAADNIAIYTLTGKPCGTVPLGMHSIDVSALLSGLYIAIVTTDAGQIPVKFHKL